MNIRTWRPYIAGVFLGILATLSVYVTTYYLGKPQYLGASTTFVRSAGMIEKALSDSYVTNNEYLQKTKIKIDWQFMLIVGVFIGAFISSISDRSFKLEMIPPLWEKRFGKSIILRTIGAFIGGIIAMYGARLADGCPSGHGLSGLMQLSVSGFITMGGFLAGGVVTAHLIFKKVKENFNE